MVPRADVPNRTGTRRLIAAVALSAALLHPLAIAGQPQQIGIIDFYGLRRLAADQVRATLTVHEGDSILLGGSAPPGFIAESERRLTMLPGVLSAHVNIVCCDAGRAIVYVGVVEEGEPALQFRAPPQGGVRLEPDVLQAGHDFADAMVAAVRRGVMGDDLSAGHSLMDDPDARAVQERFIVFARDAAALRRVLRESADAAHRALAAQVLGYAANKEDVVDDLAFAIDDPSEDVRNNALRALAAIGHAAPDRVPATFPFTAVISLLHSTVWTDRNKASFALVSLTERRSPALLAALRAGGLEPLVEMARWKSEGHATPALLILGRVGGLPEEKMRAMLTSGDRDGIISAARAGTP